MSQRLNPDDTPSGEIDETAYVARSATVEDSARVRGHAKIEPGAKIEGGSVVDGHAKVYGTVTEDAMVGGHALVSGVVHGSAVIGGRVHVAGGASVGGNARIYGSVVIPADAEVAGSAWILSTAGYAHGQIRGETWDAYTCYTNEAGWYVTLRFACKAMALSCWKKESNVAAHAYDISWNEKLYWIEAIERTVELVESIIIVPKEPPKEEPLCPL